MANYVEYVCTELNPVIKHTVTGAVQAIFDVHSIWTPGQTGNITVTFGSNGCAGCSPQASWSLVGSKSDASSPSMNLGFIDPPFDSFTFNNRTFDFNEFKDATRNYCEAGKDTCKPGWVPGATPIHELVTL